MSKILRDVPSDPEFRRFMRRLTDDERAQLAANIRTEGCRDPLVVWQEEGTLLDGHNRLSICQDEGIPFDVVEISLPDKWAAKNWIRDNQLGRRNCTPEEVSYLRGTRYNEEKRQGERTDLTSHQTEGKSQPTAERLAGEYKVGKATIERDGQFAAQVDAIAENVGDEFRDEVLARDSALAKKDVAELSQLPPDEQKAAAEAKVHNHRAQGTGQNEWYTPAEYVEAVRRVLGVIDLDPASSVAAQARVGAKAFLTADEDGLKQPWAGRVFLNPPYAQPHIADFVDKLVCDSSDGHVEEAILLTHNYTDTTWFHRAEGAATLLCFTRGRIPFERADGLKAQPTQGQTFFYFGDRASRFIKRFDTYGFIR